ncbi:MAG TPA: HAD family phosphatase [Candidatus Angelobacter sp.]|nr:HAD family phosphatase [Candidatus Angelobacter sp.]
MLQGVIFDLDGVIVDSHPAHQRAWRAFFDSLGREVSDDQLSFVLEGRKREDILRHFLGDLTSEQVKHYGERKEALFRDNAAALKVIPGICGLLNDLRDVGLPAAAASSARRGRVIAMLEQLGLTSHFKAVVAGDDVVNGKPDPAIFNIAAQGINVDAECVLVCEDSAAGIRAAKNAGMRCLGIATDGRRATLLEAGADHVLPDFTSVRVRDLRQMFATHNA